MKSDWNDKLLKTSVLISTWIFIGIFTAIIGATLIDLTEIAGCDFEQIGEVLIGLNLAVPFGSIAAGILCNRYPAHLDLMLGVSVVLLALSSAALPWCPALSIMACVMVVEGVTRGVATCCGNVMIVKLWKEMSPAPLHAMHFGTGVGSLVAPLMVGPFLSKYENSTDTTQTTEMEPYVVSQNFSNVYQGNISTPIFHGTPTKIYIPYGIMAAFGILCAFAFFLFFWRTTSPLSDKQNGEKREKTVENSKTEIKSTKCTLFRISFSKTNQVFGIQMACLLFIFYACVVGLSMSYPTYMLPVVVNGPLHLTKQDGAYLTSGFWGSFAAGRLVSSPIVKWVPERYMFPLEIFTTVITASLLAFQGLNSPIHLWVYTCLFAFVSGPIFPSGIAWAGIHLEVNGPLMAVFQCGVGFGSFIASWLGGYGVQLYGSNFPLLLNFSFAIAAVIVYGLMQLRVSLLTQKSDSFSFTVFKNKSISRDSSLPELETYM